MSAPEGANMQCWSGGSANALGGRYLYLAAGDQEMIPSAAPWTAKPEPTYGRPVFETILAGLGEGDPDRDRYVCDERGAWIKHRDAIANIDWHPRCETVDPGRPDDPLSDPWLPFPFTSRQLAALMVDGWGYFLQDAYGEWETGPDPDQLARLGLLGGKAREALEAAYAAYRHAVEMAPRIDRSLESVASGHTRRYREARKAAMAREELREHRQSDTEYTARLAKVNAAVADLDQPMRSARKAADFAHSRWRRAVVQHLLLPIEKVPAESFECLMLQSEPADRRAETLHRMQSQREFEDSAAGKAQWDLMNEISSVEQEVRYWQLFNAQNITEAGRRKDELKELNTRLSDLNARMKAVEPDGAGKLPPADIAQESDTQRQQRRLADLRVLGGEWVKRSGSWRAKDRRSGAFRKLVGQEKSNGSRNCSEKSVRFDLCAAAEAEAEVKRSGVMLKGLAP